MDTRTNMIIAKGKPISLDVLRCAFNEETQKWDVTFRNGKTFPYNRQNLIWLKDPISLDPRNYELGRGGTQFNNVAAIFVFKQERDEYWHLCFANGEERDYVKEDLEINKSIFAHPGAKNVFGYLQEVADDISVRPEEDVAILVKQYEKIDFLSERTAAAVYLCPDSYTVGTGVDASAPIFPFGCNESQFKAVSNALSNRVSVIEGPPGTGKTQTILNIIANLVLQGKTVQVVSNNNSAVENIIEKMASPRYGVDFIAALLGSSERKQDFVASQNEKYPDLSSWKNDELNLPEFFEEVQKRSIQLQDIFGARNRLAELKHERYDIQLEQTHYQELKRDVDVTIFSKDVTSEQLMEFWQEYQDLMENSKKRSGLEQVQFWLYCFKRFFTHGVHVTRLMKRNPVAVLQQLHILYYDKRLKEVEAEITALEDKLDKVDADALMTEFTEMSLKCFRAKLAARYTYKAPRKKFSSDELWKQPSKFLDEYPVVLSTTYTSRSSLGKNAEFDYVIMDEASQVDVATGTLALSCAKNAVIVGDTKQLSNVVKGQQRSQLMAVFTRHNIPAAYEFTTHSFLGSICELLGSRIPQVTLCEHYRCHPQIIEFCNQKFYHGDLLIMTEQEGENALELFTTVLGEHRRGHINQRQADVIKYEILPRLHCDKNQIGIIAPYKDQAQLLRQQLREPEIDIATVHKFQGREKDIIIFSTVDDTVNEFSDDPNLLNVAVSRAKKKLIVVASEKEQAEGSNVGDLIGYIRYNNCDVRHSEISSVFDYLYEAYTAKRLEFLSKHEKISEYDSENLMYALIREELDRQNDAALGVVCHMPLNVLLMDISRLDARECDFVNSGLSHLDFLIYNRVSKKPLLAIEVDGFRYHKEDTEQAGRDEIKNHILEVYQLPLLRFATNGSGERQQLAGKLAEILQEKTPVA